MDYNEYAMVRDASTIAKFVAKIAAHKEKLAYHKLGHGEFPRPVSKNAKWPAYEAARRLEKALGLDTHASSVPELAELVGKFIEWDNHGRYATA